MSKYSENMPPVLKDAIGWMFDYIKDDCTFLDFGCSTGYFGSLVKQAKHAAVYGVEISDDIKQARKVLDGVYSFDIDGEWPAEIYERQYDYIFFGDVIEHLKDPQLAIEKCKKLLRKDGLLFISTPNVAHISVRLELLGGNFEYESMGILDNTHLKYWTKRSLTSMVQAAGYSLKSLDYTSNDYPDTVIKKLLKQNGLEPNEKFWKTVNSPEARAFQFKLVLSPEAQTAKPADFKPVDKPEAIRNAAIDDLNTKVHNLDEHAKEQAKIIQYYVDKTKELEAQLQARRHPIHRISSHLKHKD